MLCREIGAVNYSECSCITTKQSIEAIRAATKRFYRGNIRPIDLKKARSRSLVDKFASFFSKSSSLKIPKESPREGSSSSKGLTNSNSKDNSLAALAAASTSDPSLLTSLSLSSSKADEQQRKETTEGTNTTNIDVNCYKFRNGEVFRGEFGFSHQKALFKWNNGDTYKGEFINQSLTGFGELRYFDGSYYDGTFKDQKRHGKGALVLLNGDVYEGDYKNNTKEGQGEYRYVSGNTYVGHYKDDRRTSGVYRWINGDFYEGEFSNDIQHGQGKMISKKLGYTFEGRWANGHRCHGTIIYENGDTWTGRFFKDAPVIGEVTEKKSKSFNSVLESARLQKVNSLKKFVFRYLTYHIIECRRLFNTNNF